MKAITKLMLLSLGAGAVAVWRSQQARNKASQVFDTAKDRFQDVSTSLPIGGQHRQTTTGGQSQGSTPATTTMLSQTTSDAGVGASRAGAADTASSSSGGATLGKDSEARSLAAQQSASTETATDTTLASGENSIAQPVFHAIDEHDRDGSLADIPADSLAEQSRTTASELVESSHQPDSMEVSESSEQTHTAEDEIAAQSVAPPAAAVPPQPASADNASTFRPANDPDAGQLDADGEDRTITDRIRTRLGQELEHAEWGHVNINTQALGAVYLRGYVASDELRSRIEQIVSETEGVESVVNELNIEGQNAV